jgi:hypothetical protein
MKNQKEIENEVHPCARCECLPDYEKHPYKPFDGLSDVLAWWSANCPECGNSEGFLVTGPTKKDVNKKWNEIQAERKNKDVAKNLK